MGGARARGAAIVTIGGQQPLVAGRARWCNRWTHSGSGIEQERIARSLHAAMIDADPDKAGCCIQKGAPSIEPSGRVVESWRSRPTTALQADLGEERPS